LRSFKSTDRYLRFRTQKIGIVADVASKHQTAVLGLSSVVTRTRRHTELTKSVKRHGKLVLCQKTSSSVFRAVFLTQLNCTV